MVRVIEQEIELRNLIEHKQKCEKWKNGEPLTDEEKPMFEIDKMNNDLKVTDEMYKDFYKEQIEYEKKVAREHK